jgi:hypothetical protein
MSLRKRENTGKLKEEALEPILWRTRFVLNYESVIVTEEQGRCSKTKCWGNYLSRVEKKERKVYNEKFQDPWGSIYINWTTESRRIKWARQLANIRVRYITFLMENVKEKHCLKELVVDTRILLKWILRNRVRSVNKFILLVIETNEGPSEEGDEISGSIRTGEFIDKLRSFCMSKRTVFQIFGWFFYLVSDSGKCIMLHVVQRAFQRQFFNCSTWKQRQWSYVM